MRDKRKWRQVSRVLLLGAVLGVVLSAWGFFWQDLLFSATQWLLVATVLAIFSLYARLEEK